ncbi:hypothetical protein [Helicobacter pylori]|nr:hypothetical protein [Helicobacter pylori]WRE18308.1 hypothetical protein KVE44_03110 [Helicobacter pylori]
MEQEKLQPIDLEVLQALNKKAYLPKSVGKNLCAYLNALKSNKPTKKD